MGSEGTKKQIAFDLVQEKLKEHYPKPEATIDPFYFRKAYSDIRCFMTKNGFEHRQGSVYVSKLPVSTVKVVALAKQMANEFPWLAHCARQIDVTNVSTRQYSLLGLIAADFDGKQIELGDDVKIGSKDFTGTEPQKKKRVLQDLIDVAELRTKTYQYPQTKSELPRPNAPLFGRGF